MSQAIRATLAFPEPAGCSVAAAARDAETAITQVSTSAALPGGDGRVTEFLVSGDLSERDDVEAVFPYGEATVYRTRHDGGESCPCECLGRHGCPIHRYEAGKESLTLVFHAADFETLQSVITDLQDRYPPVDVQQLLRPPLEGSPEERVFVNRGKLTDRQREVLERAYEMGYFERPKQANATEVAQDLGIAQSTFTEHLMAAQRKLLEDVLE